MNYEEFRIIRRMRLSQLVRTPNGMFVHKYLVNGKKYFFDGSIWGWK